MHFVAHTASEHRRFPPAPQHQHNTQQTQQFIPHPSLNLFSSLIPGGGSRAVRKARIFALTKGFYGKRKNCYGIARRAAERAMQAMYVGRKQKKRHLRQLWIQRINAATVEHNLNYSRFMNGLAEADVQLNRKVLSELAIHEPKSFQALCELSFRRHREAQQGLKGLL